MTVDVNIIFMHGPSRLGGGGCSILGVCRARLGRPSLPNSTISKPLGFEFGPDVRLGQQGGNPVNLLLPLVNYILGQPGPPNTAVYAGVSTPQVVGNP